MYLFMRWHCRHLWYKRTWEIFLEAKKAALFIGKPPPTAILVKGGQTFCSSGRTAEGTRGWEWWERGDLAPRPERSTPGLQSQGDNSSEGPPFPWVTRLVVLTALLVDIVLQPADPGCLAVSIAQPKPGTVRHPAWPISRLLTDRKMVRWESFELELQ